VSGQFHTTTASSPRKDSPVPTKQEAGWTQGLVWTFRRSGKYLILPGIEMRFPGFRVRSLVSIPTTPSRLPVSVCSKVPWHEEAHTLIMRTLHNVCCDNTLTHRLYTSACQHVSSLKLLKRFRINLVLSVQVTAVDSMYRP